MGKRRGKRRLVAGHIICTHGGRGMMKTRLDQIAKKAKLDPKVRFTSLAHLLTPEFLTETWGMMKDIRNTSPRRPAARLQRSIRCTPRGAEPRPILAREVTSLL